MQYFHNESASISYIPDGAGYVRIAWQPVRVSAPELQAIYEHALNAMHYHGATKLLSLHGQRPPLPVDIQTWLVQEWIPRAIQQVHYGQCAIVEAGQPLSRLAARTIGSGLTEDLQFAFFPTEEAAHDWLTVATTE
ncbi:hypothetical protein [Hymenobacter sp. BT730]|uniref:hypothetical protein n=1 Tax=Hymenobacter sp. BT730 TaxID=3063332 RepID=UPI0026E0A780|nr:hypothetical protein [Hymenobacter sp. BT730]